ncbi:sulfatase-like hydrolase/transferase [Bacteroidales bacterium OttesenSCG-928-C19]|nr:sulfatase-like hydrolase/transferase [Bacteroidales bacterium OttesenSCG-928-C19]
MKIRNKKLQTSSIYTALLLKYAIALVFFLFTQWMFFFLNRSFFSIASTGEFFSILGGGVRYALAITTVFLSPFILMNILPFRFRENKIYQTVADILYCTGTLVLSAVNIIDIVYYRFTFRRMAGDIFNYLSVGGDFKELIPQFARDFWPYVLMIVIIAILLIWITRKITWKSKPPKYKYAHLVSFLFIVAISVLVCQDGFAMKPLKQNKVVEYTTPPNASLVINTPFSIVSTLNASGVKEEHYFENEKDAQSNFSPVQVPAPRLGYFEENPTMNVVVIILESFSEEYISYLNEGRECFTPFLNSLAEKSIVFDGMANGKRSIESIPSVVAGLPSIMSDAYITSPYGKNKVNTIPSVLKKYGYYSAFFHGGYNGSMGFDSFSKLAGFDAYFGMNEYGDKKDYDGQWGIFDEPFLQYMAKEMNDFPKPFNATVFTISSHHPYTIPEQHKGKFKSGEIPILEPVMYADYALERFFETVSTYDWFENTLFVITADHTAQPIEKQYGNAHGMYKVPMFFYCPTYAEGQRIHKTVQQADILPSVVDYLNLNEPTIAFGKSAFSPDSSRFHIAFTNGFYQLMKDNYLIFFKDKIVAAYNMLEDPLLKKNLVNLQDSCILEQEKFVKSFIQQYNYRLIHNHLTTETSLDNEQS